MKNIFKLTVLTCLTITATTSWAMQQQAVVQASALDSQLETAIKEFPENHTAALRDVKRLIDQGANVNARFEGNNTALHFAVIVWEAEPLIELLVSKGANPSLKNDMGLTPFDRAGPGGRGGVREDYLAILGKYVSPQLPTGEIKAQPSKPAAPLAAPVAKALPTQAKPAAPSVTSVVPDIDKPSADGDTQLTAAVQKFFDDRSASMQEVMDLLNRGANPNAKDSNGWAPLMWAAALRDSQDLIKLLLSKGADPKLTNNSGKTARDIAVQFRREQNLEVLGTK